jgi:Ring finger domain
VTPRALVTKSTMSVVTVVGPNAHELLADPCPVCLEPLTDISNGPATILHPCLHVIHASCWSRWAARGRRTCPECRTLVTHPAPPAGQTVREAVRAGNEHLAEMRRGGASQEDQRAAMSAHADRVVALAQARRLDAELEQHRQAVAAHRQQLERDTAELAERTAGGDFVAEGERQSNARFRRAQEEMERLLADAEAAAVRRRAL